MYWQVWLGCPPGAPGNSDVEQDGIMTGTITAGRTRSVAQRRAGYCASIVVNGVLLYLINVAPGWRIVPFLTSDFSSVLPWINASMVLSIVTGAVYLVIDAPLVKGIGDLLTQCVGLVALVELWRVFPFETGSDAWPAVFRVVLAVGIVGTVIGVIVTAVVALAQLPPFGDPTSRSGRRVEAMTKATPSADVSPDRST